MIREALWCAAHPFQCIGDALGPYWWAIGLFAGLILIGFAINAARVAYRLGGWPAVVGALGILGTIAVAVLSLFAGRREVSEPTDIDGPDATPPIRTERAKRPVRTKRIFPNAPWNKGD